ncbi:MAG: O-antigen ligase family protein [Candidatus Ozemobacteraceae bacterium]
MVSTAGEFSDSAKIVETSNSPANSQVACPPSKVELLKAPSNAMSRLYFAGLLAYAFFAPFSITGSQIALSFSLVALGILWHRGEQAISFTRADAAFGGFALAGLLSLAGAIDLSRGISEMKKFLIIFAFWLPLWRPLPAGKRQTILGILIGISSFISIFGLLKLVYVDYADYGITRAEGFFSLPLTFGEFNALTMLTTLFWLHAGDSRPVVRVGLLLAFFFQMVGLVTSFTRGAWLGFGAGFLVLIFQNPRKFLSVFLICFLLCGVGASFSSGMRSRLATFTTVGDGTSSFRIRIWQLGYEIISLNPVFGVGMNCVKPHYQARVTPYEVSINEVHGHLHNSYLQYAAMTGLFGYVLFWWWTLELFALARSGPTRMSALWDATMASHLPALFACFFVTGITEYSFGDEEVAMLFFFLVGLLLNPMLIPKSEKP